MKEKRFYILLLIISCFLGEVGSAFALYVLQKLRSVEYTPILTHEISERTRGKIDRLLKGDIYYQYLKYDPVMGWAIKKNGTAGIYRANSQGIRSDKEYSQKPRHNKIRIASFGDSFTHGDEVGNSDTWQEYMNTTEPSFEVINFGVSGYGLDQAFLRYQVQGSGFDPDVVVIGYMTENINRSVNVFPPFYTPDAGSPLPMTKPRYTLRDNQLELLQNPMNKLFKYKEILNNPDTVLPEIGVNDFHYQSGLFYKTGWEDASYTVKLMKMVLFSFRDRSNKWLYDTEAEPYLIVTEIFNMFYNQVLRDGSLPVIVIFPHKENVISSRRNGGKDYANLLAYLDSKRFVHIDIAEKFEEHNELTINELFNGTHYSPLGNKLVADYILEYMKNHVSVSKNKQKVR